jgi:hypothetical protein
MCDLHNQHEAPYLSSESHDTCPVNKGLCFSVYKLLFSFYHVLIKEPVQADGKPQMLGINSTKAHKLISFLHLLNVCYDKDKNLFQINKYYLKFLFINTFELPEFLAMILQN